MSAHRNILKQEPARAAQNAKSSSRYQFQIRHQHRYRHLCWLRQCIHMPEHAQDTVSQSDDFLKAVEQATLAQKAKIAPKNQAQSKNLHQGRPQTDQEAVTGIHGQAQDMPTRFWDFIEAGARAAMVKSAKMTTKKQSQKIGYCSDWAQTCHAPSQPCIENIQTSTNGFGEPRAKAKRLRKGSPCQNAI